MTEFVCKYDDLEDAKKRHDRCVEVLGEDYNIVAFSSRAYDVGRGGQRFSSLLSRVIVPGSALSGNPDSQYSLFHFVTIVTDLKCVDDIPLVSRRLEIDFEENFPARFPSLTTGVPMEGFYG
ncbi:hypothetical protein [Corynebacterium sp. 21KM1197]|uniref:hypothetical protein n=1 Tax=Corynebacterium sp. 21KM1197 TaxID=2989734 RepID=UPI0029CA00CB|nr:hypothetical protein [Corynebacterium sp. 21KM1197]WPF68420.1 hypothetical protein OLW90_10285 [Corynebacterium sp. 21KM1197]